MFGPYLFHKINVIGLIASFYKFATVRAISGIYAPISNR